MDKSLLRKAYNTADNLVMEMEFMENALDLFRLGIENDNYSDKKLELACVHVLEKYVVSVRHEYVEELFEILRSVVKNECDNLPITGEESR